MIKRLVAAGTAAAGVAALSLGIFASPAHADVTCNSTTYLFHLTNGQEICTEGTNFPITYELNLKAVFTRSGQWSGYLVNSSGQHVSFSPHQQQNFGPGVVFKQIHFNGL